MAQNLLIVESQKKAKTIARYLGNDWQVEPTFGHFRGLPAMEGQAFGDVVDLASFEEKNVVHDSRTTSRLRRAISAARVVWIATDDDREGEAIAWHLVEEFGLKAPHRVRFHSFDADAVRASLENPGEIDFPLVDAARVRSILDYEFGLEVSRRLWRFGCKSAGRVQSAGLRLIVDREDEIAAFKAKPFWTISAQYEGFTATILEPRPSELDDDLDEPAPDPAARLVPRRFFESEGAAQIVRRLKVIKSHRIENVDRTQRRRRPHAPFSTDALLAAASTKLDMAADKTMKVAQALFEAGKITYHRTDATVLSEAANVSIRAWLKENHPDLVPEKIRTHQNKAEQGAHEAIRPTSIAFDPSGLDDDDERALYTLIRNRTCASQAKDAVLARVLVTVAADDIRLGAVGDTVLEEGWFRLETPAKLPDVRLPSLNRGDEIDLIDAKVQASKTRPPARYTEARFIRLMKREGIGRPSTYATVVQTLKRREYVEFKKKQLHPTDLGRRADGLTRGPFGELTQAKFTAKTEARLDSVATGKLGRRDLLRHFHARLQKMLEDADGFHQFFAQRNPELDRDRLRLHDDPCPACGSKMRVLTSKAGEFAACTSTGCKKTVSLTPLSKAKAPCPDCGAAVLIQPYRKGKATKKFYRCEKECGWTSGFEPPEVADDPCPDCGGAVVVQKYKKDKKLKTFFRCGTKCGWSSSFPPPQVTVWPCHVDPDHGPMVKVEYVKDGERREFFLCRTCKTRAFTGPKPPKCPSCDNEMRARREGSSGTTFWGCATFPVCRATLPFGDEPKEAPRDQVPSRSVRRRQKPRKTRELR